MVVFQVAMYSHFSVVVLHFYVHFYLIFIVLICVHYTCTLFSYDMFTPIYVYLYFVILLLLSPFLSLIMCHAPLFFLRAVHFSVASRWVFVLVVFFSILWCDCFQFGFSGCNCFLSLPGFLLYIFMGFFLLVYMYSFYILHFYIIFFWHKYSREKLPTVPIFLLKDRDNYKSGSQVDFHLQCIKPCLHAIL
jgi:hypothetical protein